MTIRSTVLNDYRSTDGTESVTLTTYLEGSSATTSITRAAREGLSVREVASGFGQWRGDEIVWHLSDNQISAANKPKPGDTITDSDSVIFRIVTALLDELKVIWRCVTVQER